MSDETAAKILFSMMLDMQHYLNKDALTALEKGYRALIDKSVIEDRK